MAEKKSKLAEIKTKPTSASVEDLSIILRMNENAKTVLCYGI